MTSTIVLQAKSFFAACRPVDLCADSVAVALRAFQLQAQPVVSFRGIVFQQQRSGTIVADQNVESAVIVEVTYCQASCSEIFLKCRTTLVTDVVQLAVFTLMKEQQRFLVFH